MPLRPCPSCASHFLEGTCTCPHCGASVCARSSAGNLPAAALLMGLALAGCDHPYPVAQPEYGIAIDTVDHDLDGYAESEGDCDDANIFIHPDADETPGDDVDSNCDGEDDT